MPSERDQIDRVIRELPHRALQLQEHLALALMVAAKWDRAYARFGPSATSAQAAASDNFTVKELGDYREAAARMMNEHAASVAQPKENWLTPVAQGVLAAFCYSILLIAFGVIGKLLGYDVLDAVTSFKEFLKH